MRKKFTMIISMLILSLLLAGCSIEVHEDPNKQKSVYYLYDISADENTASERILFSRGDNCGVYAERYDAADEQSGS